MTTYKFTEAPSAAGELIGDSSLVIRATENNIAAIEKGDVVAFVGGKIIKADTGDLSGAYGVALDAIPQGGTGRVCIEGIVSVASTAAAITVGAYVAASATDGKVQAAAAGDIVCGYALTDVSSAGGLIVMKIINGNAVVIAAGGA